MRKWTVTLAVLAFGLPPVAAVAGGGLPAPHTIESGAYLDLFGSHERDQNHYQARNYRWSDTFFREKVTVYTNGYWYHPRFLAYKLSVGGGFKQESFHVEPIDRSNSRSGTSIEYDGRVILLPEHPYTVELFARRYEPLIKEESATRHNNVETSRGLMVRFRKPEYFFHARYTNDRFQPDGTSADVTRYGADGEYLKRYRNGNQLSFSAAWNPSRYSNTSGVDGRTNDLVLGNYVILPHVHLDSSLSRTTQDQTRGTLERFETKQLVWYERLNLYLPWKFRSDLTYRYQDGERTIADDAAPGDRRLEDKGRDLQFHLIHRLYESLDTTYGYLRAKRTYSGGESTSTAHALTLNYTKAIPRGRILAGVNLGRSDTDNAGRAEVVNETHVAIAVPGTFRLGQVNVSGPTIEVYLRSPLPPYESIRLAENVHYTVTAIASTWEVNLVTLPPEFTVPGTYDFFVSYALERGDFRLRTDTKGGNLSVELLDTRVTPYLGYVSVRTKVLGGAFPGVPLDSTTKTAGVILRFGRLRGVGEWQKVEWDVNPYRQLRAELQYTGTLGPTSNLYLRGVYQDRNYPDGTPFSAPTHTDRSWSASASVQKNFLARRLVVSGTGGYSRFTGQVDSRSYYVNTGVTFKINLMDLTAGATASKVDATGSAGVPLDRTHQYVYVQLRRRLF